MPSVYTYASINDYVAFIKANYPVQVWNELADVIGQYLGWLERLPQC